MYFHGNKDKEISKSKNFLNIFFSTVTINILLRGEMAVLLDPKLERGLAAFFVTALR